MAKARVMQRNEKGEMVEADIEPKIITQEMAGLIGTQMEPVIMEVERGAIRRYAEAAEDGNPLYRDVEYARNSRYGEITCPPGFFGWPAGAGSATRASIFGKIRDLSGLKTGMDNGGELEFFAPIRAGDTLTSVTRLADLYEEVGRSGNSLLLIIHETDYINQYGEMVARGRSRALLI